MTTLVQVRNLVWRTLVAFFPRLAKPDDTFAKTYLTGVEYTLYAEMDVRERDHACQVAKAVIARMPAPSDYLIRAALLHDVGKGAAHYNPWERIAVHLYAPQTLSAEPRLNGLRGAWQRRHYHPQYGAELICRRGGDERVATIVAGHHEPKGLKEAEQLKAVEERF